jgi:hypothetical protein
MNRQKREEMKLAFAMLLFLGVCGSAHAEMVRSETLYGWLEESMRAEGNFKDRTMAVAYVAAVRDLLEEEAACIPESQRGRRTLQTVRDWMKTNIGRWEQPAARTVARALRESFPCGGANR